MHVSNISAIIVDDEPAAREGLEVMLSKDKDIEVVEICKNGIEAIQALKENLVDLVFLDIQMPGINGFEVLDNIPQDRWPFVVFVTAYDKYAVKAFEYHAFDYMLKPFTDERFQEMMTRVKLSIQSKRKIEQSKKFEQLKIEMQSHTSTKRNDLFYYDQNTGQESLVIKDSGEIFIIPVAEIFFIEAFDYYIKVHYKTQFKLARIPLKDIMTRLPEHIFIRIHRSSIINISHLERIEKKGKGELKAILRSGKEVRISDTYKKELMHRLNSG
jgi:two-component system LytT family response regulator